MVSYGRASLAITLLVCLFGLAWAAPNFFPQDDAEPAMAPRGLASLLPHRRVNLGLDLQGGAHLLLEVGVDEVIVESLGSTESEVRRALFSRENGGRIGFRDLKIDGQAISFRLVDPADMPRALERVRTINPELQTESAGEDLIRLTMTPESLQRRQENAVTQSIEVVRRRVDETGTSEPTIQRQGTDRILVQLPGVRDPERIKRLLGQTAKLTFHLVDPSVSPADISARRVPPGTAIMEEATDTGIGARYAVRREVVVGGEDLVNAQPSFQDGQPMVSFTFNTAGGRKFGAATSENVGQLLAIVLDDQVVSAPVIQSPILGGSGVITGQFTVQEASDLALVLRAGALPAPLTVLEERTVGPGLGADSVDAGKIASITGLIAVLIFMALGYRLFGLMADVALVINIALILAILSTLQATLTLPGIAGVVLTIGMAVDANVLIFERIREEIRLGRTPISAVDAGYRRALTTITDSNLTTLIAAVLLFQFGSGPIKGFAVTLSVGIVSSMFTAIMVTRLLVVLWLRRRRPDTLPI